MVNAVSSGSAASSSAGPAASPASLSAQLNTCRAQLEDWVTCPSSKTPEGKAKIKTLNDRYDAIKRQIDQAQQTASQRSAKVVEAAKDPGAAGPDANASRSGRNSISLLGARLDVYA